MEKRCCRTDGAGMAYPLGIIRTFPEIYFVDIVCGYGAHNINKIVFFG